MASLDEVVAMKTDEPGIGAAWTWTGDIGAVRVVVLTQMLKTGEFSSWKVM